MAKFDDILSEYRAMFTRTILYLGAFLSVFIGFVTAKTESGELSVTSYTLFAGALVFLALVPLARRLNYYRLSANLAMINICILLIASLYFSNSVEVSGSFAYMPLIVTVATLLCGNRVGFIITSMFILLLAFISQKLLVLGSPLDQSLFIDRALANIFSFLVAFLFNWVLSLSLDKIQKQEGELNQQEKLVSLGVFASGIAHEVKNPLAVSLGAFDLLKKKISIEGSVESDRWLSTIERNLKRIDQVIDSLLFLTWKPGFRQTENLDLIAMDVAIEETVSILKPKMQRLNVKVNSEFGPSIKIYCKLFHLVTVLRIIVDNALDALQLSNETNGRIDLEYVITEQSLIVQIRDNGPGISEDIKSKVLDPFFTTKDVGQGSGVGLSLAYGICQTLDWRLSFVSEPGNTCFEICIPKDKWRMIDQAA